MTIPLAQIEQVLNAGHADDAIVGIPVSLLREFVRALKPVEVRVVPTIVGFDTGHDVAPA